MLEDTLPKTGASQQKYHEDLAMAGLLGHMQRSQMFPSIHLARALLTKVFLLLCQWIGCLENRVNLCGTSISGQSRGTAAPCLPHLKHCTLQRNGCKNQKLGGAMGVCGNEKVNLQSPSLPGFNWV